MLFVGGDRRIGKRSNLYSMVNCDCADGLCRLSAGKDKFNDGKATMPVTAAGNDVMRDGFGCLGRLTIAASLGGHSGDYSLEVG